MFLCDRKTILFFFDSGRKLSETVSSLKHNLSGKEGNNSSNEQLKEVFTSILVCVSSDSVSH